MEYNAPITALSSLISCIMNTDITYANKIINITPPTRPPLLFIATSSMESFILMLSSAVRNIVKLSMSIVKTSSTMSYILSARVSIASANSTEPSYSLIEFSSISLEPSANSSIALVISLQLSFRVLAPSYIEFTASV